MIIDLLLLFFFLLTLFRFARAIFMRLSLLRRIHLICKDKKYTFKNLTFPLTSIFFKTKRIDLNISTFDCVYHIKFISSLSPKKNYHFIDENNYITYTTMFFVLPMAKKSTESIHFLSYHRFPTVEKTADPYHKYILLFNPLPNEISYIAENGSKQIAGNGSMLGDFYIHNGKGFCALLEEQ